MRVLYYVIIGSHTWSNEHGEAHTVGEYSPHIIKKIKNIQNLLNSRNVEGTCT